VASLRKQIARWTRHAIIGTVISSAAMNAFAFAAQTSTAWMTSAPITLGIAIPTLVDALMPVGAAPLHRLPRQGMNGERQGGPLMPASRGASRSTPDLT
jgi:hypothetical protein